MMETQDVMIASINVPNRLRSIDPDKVSSIASSIKEVGLISPIILYSPDEDTLDLVAGAHRLEAVKSLNWSMVTASLIEDENNLFAQLVEIDENLCRSELSATQYAEHVQRRKEVWEAMRSNEVSESDVPKPNGRPREFASETANTTGQTRQHINRSVRRANKVCQEARDIIRGTEADTGSFLDQLSKLDDESDQIQAAQDKVDAIERRKRSLELQEEEKARKAAAKEQQRQAKTECLNFLFEKLHSRDWQYLISKLDESCSSLSAGDLRNWESPQ